MSLQQFQGDFNTREELNGFLFASIEREALRRMYAGEDVSHIKDAKFLIEKAFEELDDIYKPIVQPNEPINYSK